MTDATNIVLQAAKKQEVIQAVVEKNLVVTSITHQQISVTELFSKLFLHPHNLLILTFLVLIGVGMKRSKVIPDWAIIFTMPVIGIMLTLTLRAILGNLDPAIALMVGGCDGIAAFSAHQVLKQTMESPAGPALMKVPFFTILVAIVDEDMLKPALDRQTKIRQIVTEEPETKPRGD